MTMAVASSTDQYPTNTELLAELTELRRRVVDLETAETRCKQAEAEREHLLAAEREQRLLAETLTEVTLALTAHTNHIAVLDEILYQVRRIVPYSAANIMLLENDTLGCVRWQGYERFHNEAFISTLVQLVTDFFTAAEAVHTKQPVVIPHTDHEPRWVVLPETAWIKSQLTMPICLADHVLGLFQLDSDTPERFSTADAARLIPLANAAAIALENASLYEQVQQELTKRKQIVADLARVHQTLAFHVENSPLAVLEWDNQFRLRRWSKRAEEIFGWKAEELLGKRTDEWPFIYIDDVEKVRPITNGLLRGSLPRSVNRNRNYTKSGAVVHCEWYESVLFDSSGQLISILSLVQDVTERVKAEEALQDRQKFETLITTISTNFINMPVDKIDAEISQALQLIGEFVGVDYCYVFLLSADGTTVSNTHSWRQKGVKDPIARLQELPVESFPGLRAKLSQFETVYIPSVAKMAPEMSGEQKFLQAQGVQSLIQVPMVSNKELKGILGFASGRTEKRWSADIINLLKIVSEIFVNALERKQVHQELKDRAYQQELLLKEIHHRVKNNLQIVSSLLRLQTRYTHDQAAQEILRDSQQRLKSMALIHAKLYQSQNLARIDFANYLHSLGASLFQSYAVDPASISFKIQVDELFLDIDTAITCGLIINELVSNSLKYAFPPALTTQRESSNQIYLELKATSNDQFTIIVRDNGVGLPAHLDPFQTESLGLQLVMRLSEQLKGHVAVDRSQGTTFAITFSK